MVSQQHRLLGILLVFGLVSCGLGGCSSSSGGGSGSTGATSSGGASVSGSGGGSGGATSTGVSSSSGGASASGGSVASGGTKGSGGAQETGGSVGTGGSNSGGTRATGGTSSDVPATGGSSTGGAATGGSGRGGSSSGTAMGGTGGMLSGGTGGMATGTGGAAKGGTSGGGDGGTGGMATGTGGAAKGGTSGGGRGGTGGAAPGGTSGTSSGGCQKGQVKAKEVVIMGESFYAMDPKYIQKRIEENAKKAGAIGSSDSYRNVAISGQPMSVVAGKEWDDAVAGGAIKVIIMDGGGIDCMSSSCSSCPDTFKTLLGKMATAGVQNVIYTRYPEPGNPPGSNTSLKGNLDILMPKMQPVCEGATGLKCHWVDLRPVWVNGDTSDGLHPTQSGGNHVGDLIWSEMVKDCIAQ